jgi:hypothetical protein
MTTVSINRQKSYKKKQKTKKQKKKKEKTFNTLHSLFYFILLLKNYIASANCVKIER